MSSCITGREVVVRFRHRKTGVVKCCSVVCPAIWQKARLLSYVRREHPQEAITIRDWKPIATEDDRWATRLWIVNPAEMMPRIPETVRTPRS